MKTPVLCVVSDRFRFICLLIAKNATSTLREEFGRPRYESYELRYVQIDPRVRDAYFTFAVLREPVSRLLSAYHEISVRFEWAPQPNPQRRFHLMDDTPERFDAFLEALGDTSWDEHVRRQVDYLERVRVDGFTCVERLAAGLGQFFQQLDMGPCPTLPVRRSRKEHKEIYGERFLLTEDDLDEAARTRIEQIYDADIRLYRKAILGSDEGKYSRNGGNRPRLWSKPVVKSAPPRHPVLRLSQSPVIIGGCARSGTTLLNSLLSAHPQIYAIGRNGKNLESHALCQPSGVDPHRLALLFDQQLKHLTDDYSWWCEKSPSNVRHIGAILDFFGESVRFLNIVRDGRDVVTSAHPDAPDRYWVHPKRWVQDVGAGRPFDAHPQVHLVHYEALVADPNRILREICEFLQLKYDPALADYPRTASIRTSHAWGGEAAPVHSRSVERWRNPAHRARVLTFLETEGAVSLLKHYGYAVESHGS